MTRGTALAWLIKAASQALPDLDDAWGDAMGAEVQAIPSHSERVAFTVSSLRGLVVIAISRQLRRWQTNALVLLIAASSGILVGAIDVRVDSRWPLRVGVLLSCAAVGWVRPRVARTAGVLAGLGLPLVVTVSGYPAPYQLDRGDMWFPLLPALIIAASAAALRQRLMPLRPS